MSKYSEIAPDNREDLIKQFGNTYSYIKNGDEVLDVGCSSGYYGQLLQIDKQCIVDGVEIDKEDLEKARKVLRKVYDFDLDSEKWPPDLLKHKYDVIFLGDIIEHVKSASVFLGKLDKLLKKDGRIIISTPNIAHITARLELLGGNFEYENTGIFDETHLKYFTLASLKHLSQKAGFKIVEADYSLADLMPDLVNHWLKKLGLEPSDKFWKIINKPEARAYQYKLVLVRKTGPKDDKKVELPNKPLDDRHWFLGQVELLNNEHKKDTNKITRLEQREAELKSYADSLAEELNRVKSSPAFRAEAKLKRAVRKVKKKKVSSRAHPRLFWDGL